MQREVPKPEAVPYLLREALERLDDIESELKDHAPAVLATKIDTLAKTVSGLQTALWTVGGGLFITGLGIIGTLLATGGH